MVLTDNHRKLVPLEKLGNDDRKKDRSARGD